MKKVVRNIIALVTALIGCSIAASAQERSKFEQELSLGLFGGANMSQVRFLHNSTAYTSLIGDQSLFNHRGTTFGFSALYIAQNHFGVIIEAAMTQKGYCEKFRARKGEDVRMAGVDTKVDFNGVDLVRDLTYIDVPLFAHIYFGSKSRAYLNIGPQISFLIKEKSANVVTDEQSAILGDKDPRINEDMETADIDLSIASCVGYDFHARNVHACLEVRWSYGIHDLYPHDKRDLFQRSNTQNFGLALKVYVPVLRFHSN